MSEIAKSFVCKDRDENIYMYVVTNNNEVFSRLVTPRQIKDGIAQAFVVGFGADLTASGILDDIIATLLKNSPAPSAPCEEKKEAEAVGA